MHRLFVKFISRKVNHSDERYLNGNRSRYKVIFLWVILFFNKGWKRLKLRDIIRIVDLLLSAVSYTIHPIKWQFHRVIIFRNDFILIRIGG